MWMQLAIVITTHILLPLFFIGGIAAGRLNSAFSLLASVVLATTFLTLIHAAGGWFWVGAFWPALFWLLLVFAVVLALLHRLPALPRWPPGRRHWLEPGISLLVSAFLASALPSILSAGSFPDDAVALQFPLSYGEYRVIQGGSSEVLNHHYPVPAQRYALDIVKTAAPGWRARGLRPSQLDAYYIWGQPVLAPCTGEVVAAERDLPDLPLSQADQENVAGNYVAVACQGVTVVMGHLQAGSVDTAVGESVIAGTPLARVGNSGNTSEPHLHIHAVRGRIDAYGQAMFQGQGVPMTFSGRFLIRNESIVSTPDQ